MSKVLSMRLREEQMARLQRLARRMNRTPSEAAALLLEESLRETEFAFIEFRDSAAGRQAYIQGSRVAVWQVVSIARAYRGDIAKTAEHLGWHPVRVQAALNYAEAFPGDIEAALAENDKGYEELKRLLPGIQLFEDGHVVEANPDAGSGIDAAESQGGISGHIR
jgi:predicted transcriptional regulator